MLGRASLLALAVAAAPAWGQTVDITTPAGSATTISQGAGQAIVTTTAASTPNSTAVNRFDHFNIASGQGATLVLPGGTTNLINLVRDRATINGILTSTIGSATGKVGGNLIFVSPNGLIVGTTGTINTGRLIVRGAGGFDGTGPIDANTVATVLGGGSASLVQLNGAVNAPGGVDIKAASVSIGATAKVQTGVAGLAAIANPDINSLVNIAGIPQGTAIVARDGGIAIVADGDVSIAGSNGGATGAVLDARPVNYQNGATNGTAVAAGIGIAAGGAITVNGRLTAWDTSQLHKAGDVVIAAKSEKLLGTSPDSIASTQFFADSSATASVAVGGRIFGGNVSITAEGIGSTVSGFNAPRLGLAALVGAGQAAFFANASAGVLALDAFVSLAHASTSVTIGAKANVVAQSNLLVSASSTAASSAVADTQPATTQTTLAAAVGYSGLSVDSTVQIDGALTAGGGLTVKAADIADSTVAVRISTMGTLALAFGYNDISAHATVGVGSAAHLSGNTVAINATNTQAGTGFVTKATTITAGQGQAGGVGTLTRQDVSANVSVAGMVTATGDIAIGADTTIAHDVTSASASAGTGFFSNAKFIFTGANLDSLIQAPIAFAQAKLVDTFTADPTKKPDLPTNREAGAVSVALVDYAADASVSGVLTSGGKVTVSTNTADLIARNNASASVSAKKKDGNAAAITIAGAIAWGDYNYGSGATVSGNVTADSLAVNANTYRPRGDFYDLGIPDSGSGGDILKFFQDTVASKLNGNLGLVSGFFGSSAGASVAGDTAKPAVAGSIDFTAIDANTRAWIDRGAQLTLASKLDVLASTTIYQLALAGPIVPTEFGAGVRSGGKGYGGALGYLDVAPITVAGIDDGVTVQRRGTAAINAAVNATTDLTLITLAPLAGAATDGGLTGTLAINQVGGETHATVGSGSVIDLGSGTLALGAASKLQLWAVAGSLAYAQPGGGNSVSSVGVAGAVNLVDLDTRAKIGDASDDDITTDSGAVIPGFVQAGSIDATANSTGSINALSVAGVLDSAAAMPGTPAALSGNATAKTQGASDALAGAAGDSAAAYGARKAAELIVRGISESTSFSDAASKGTKPQGTLGVAGSASLNIATLATTVDLHGADLRHLGSAAGHVTARATEGVDLLALTGAAALAIGTTPLSSVKLISGAYGLSYTDNPTLVTVDGSTIGGFDSVAIEAANNGSRIGAGLSLSADTTETTDGFVLAASVSQLIVKDSAQALVTGSSITGRQGGTGNVSILGYNGLVLGAGAGGLSWGSSTSIGAAFTVIQADSPGASTATLTGTSVANFANLSVRALNASRVAGIAAAGSVSLGAKKGTAGAASISVNQINLDATAHVDLAGTNAVQLTGALTVYAGDLGAGATDPIQGQGRTTATLGSSYFGDFDFGITGGHLAGLDPATPISASDLAGGSRILSVAIPISIASGGSAAGVAFSYNRIDNDRSATISGGGAGSITAGSVAVQALDRSSIFSWATGVGASANGSFGLVGSLSLNQISGSVLADVGGAGRLPPKLESAAAGATGVVPLTFTLGPVGATPNLLIDAEGQARIFSLAGAVGLAKNSAGALALSFNEITRGSSGATPEETDAGLHAALDTVILQGTPDVRIAAVNDGAITGFAVAGTFSAQGAAVSGASSVNRLAPVVVAGGNQINYTTRSTGSLTISARDTASISSIAASAAVSGKVGFAAGVAVNQIDTQVLATLSEGTGQSILAKNLLVQAGSLANISTFGFGFALANQFAAAGSIAINTTNARADSLVTINGGTIDLTGSMGVLATRDSAIDTTAGVFAFGGNNAAGGASIVVDDVGGGASALVTGGDHGATIHVGGAGAGIGGVRTGDLLSSLPEFDALSPAAALDTIKGTALTGAIKPTTGTIRGFAVNASSTHISRTVALTGAAAAKLGAAATVVVDTIGGRSEAAVSGVNVTVGNFSGTPSANNALAADIRASTQSDAISLAGAFSLGALAAAAPVVSDGFTATTSAHVDGGSLRSTGTVTVRAAANQADTALAVSAGLSSTGTLAVAGVSPRFQATTIAAITNPTALVALGTGGVKVDADADARAYAAFGALAASGGSSAAAAIVVATNENVTDAHYTGLLDPVTGLGSTGVVAPAFTVNANGAYTAHVVGGSLAAGGEGIGIAGNGVGIVDRSSVSAIADGLLYANPLGSVGVHAQDLASFQAQIGQLGAGTAGVALGVIAILQQGKVNATLIRPAITATDVAVDAYGATAVDAFQLGLAAGGVALGANVTYIGIGEVADTGALFAGAGTGDADAVAAEAGSDGAGHNAKLDSLAGGGTSPADALTPVGALTDTSAATDGAGTGRLAFAQVGSPSGASAATVSATVTNTLRSGAPASAPAASSIAASHALAITSSANVVSRSANYQGAIGLAAGSATIAILRNAASSEAALGAGVAASGGILTIAAATGQDRSRLPGTFMNPMHAAEAIVVGGTLGAGALGVGIADADVTLDTAVRAHSDGTILFDRASILASDTTDAITNVIGVSAGLGALNLAVARSDKHGSVGADISGSAMVGDLTIGATGGGRTSATTVAAAGGALFAGNGAVALASDARDVAATIAEGALIGTQKLTLSAIATPVLDAHALGIAVGGGVGIGVSVAKATSTVDVSALVGEGAVLGCGLYCALADGGVTINAAIVAGSSNVEAFGVAGGILAGLNGSAAIGQNNGTVRATLGADLSGTSSAAVILGPQDLTISASRDFTQTVNAFGATAALGLAFGEQLAEADASGIVSATFGNADGSRRDGGSDLTVTAYSHDTNDATSKAGAGALGAGVATQATTSNASVVTATVAPPAPGADGSNHLVAGNVTVTATAATDYRAITDATEASVVGGSGSTSRNSLNSQAIVAIGRPIVGAAAGLNSRLEAASFTIAAKNIVGLADTNAGSAHGAGGGVLNGAAALIDDSVNQVARVDVFDGATLRQYGGGFDQNIFRTLIDASVVTSRAQTAALDIGGLVEAPYARIDSKYSASTAVNIGKNVLIRADQGVGIGTSTQQTLVDTAASQVYGLAGIGGASTRTESTVTQNVTVGNGAVIEAIGDVRLGAGMSGDGAHATAISTNAQTDVFNWTLLPITTDHDAIAVSNLTNTLTIGAALVRSARDVTLTALNDGASAAAVGTGHNPYLGLFGLTDTNGDATGNGHGMLTLNAAQITAGFLANRTISIVDGTNPGSWIATETDYDGTSIVTRRLTSNGKTNPVDPGDPDRLGRYAVFNNGTTAAAVVNQQITYLTGQAQTAGLDVPADPNLIVDPTQQQIARAALDAAAARSAIIAQLENAYDTRFAIASSPSGATKGVEVSGVFAGGGIANIDADAIAGHDARIVATSSPTIAITNTSALNLLLGQLYAPSKPAGTISFGGAATATNLAAVATIKTASASDTPKPQISATTGVPLSSVHTDLIAFGPINNVGGGFTATINTGNFSQFGSIQVGDFNAVVPTGLFSVSNPFGDFTQANPINLYYGLEGYSLYANQGGTGPTLDANTAAQLIASYEALATFGLATTPNARAALTAAEQLYVAPGTPGDTSDANYDPTAALFADGLLRPTGSGFSPFSGSTIWGSCFERCEATSADGELNNNGDGGNSVYQNVNGSRDYAYSIPGVSYRDVVSSAAVNAAVQAQAAANPGGTIRANQVRINAAYVNISGSIVAGPDKTRTLSIAAVGADQLTSGKPLQDLGFATGNIGVHYVADANGGYLQLDDVDAGAGGLIDITGRILNTNPAGGGELRVLNGFADIAITNNSQLALHVGQLNAGVNSVGTIRLTDLAADGSVERSIYTDAPGQGVSLEHIVGGVSTITSLGALGTPGNSPIVYTPRGAAYYVFTDTRQITRDFTVFDNTERDIGGLKTTDNDVTPWQYAPGGQQPQGDNGHYVDLAGGSQDAFDIGNAIGGAGNANSAAFVQLVSGSVAPGDVATYSHGDYDGQTFNFLVPTKATITIRTAVKATYPINLVFDSGGAGSIYDTTSGGTIQIDSFFAPVVVGGAISLGGGTVGILGSSIQQGKGSIYAQALELAAFNTFDPNDLAQTSDIGSADKPIVATVAGSLIGDPAGTLANPRYVFAQALGGSVYLNLSSNTATGGVADPVRIENIIARDTVSISTPDVLVGDTRDGNTTIAGLANISAHDIVLNADGGIAGQGDAALQFDPLRRPGLIVNLTQDSRIDGGLTVTSGGDVTIQSVLDPLLPITNELRIASITTPGDVLLRGWGSIVAASDVTTIDQAKLDRFLAAANLLQLAPGGAACAGESNCGENADKLAAIDLQLRDQARAAFDALARTGGAKGVAVTNASKAYDAMAASSRIGLLNDLKGQGVKIGANWTVSLGAAANIQPGSALYTLALSTLRTLDNRVNGDLTGAVHSETIPVPTTADIQRGLQAYVDQLRAPLATAFGADATATTILKLTSLDAVSGAITASGYLAAATADHADAAQTLTSIFGLLPRLKKAIDTAPIVQDYLSQRERGAVWMQSQLDFAVPTTAFVPVADTQFKTRPPVITAHNLTLVAGNSIGNFANPDTFSFTDAGLTYENPNATEAEKAAARAEVASYLASSGPGDLLTVLTYNTPGIPSSGVASVTFTTRRDIPLQLDVSGTVNAFAATDPLTLHSNSANSYADLVNGDIFLNNRQVLTIGSIISQKVKSALDARDDCNISAAGGTVGCDSRIRLQGSSIIGTTSGGLYFNPSFGTPLSDPMGRAVIVGGLVRLEASQGDLESADGSALLVDVRTLETLRAAGDISIARRNPVSVPYANPDTGADYTYPSDLILGDVFAGGRFTIDNPYGAILVNGIPSSVTSENRNARIVANEVRIRAAGDLGSAALDAGTGLAGFLDVQAPLIETFIAGADYSQVAPGSYDYSGVTVGSGDPATGNGFLSVRGAATIGGGLFGAQGALTVRSTQRGFASGSAIAQLPSLDFEAPARVGAGFLALTATGSLKFGPSFDLTILGASRGAGCASLTSTACTVNLGNLAKSLRGTLDLATAHTLEFTNLAASGGTVRSTGGSILVRNSLTGSGGMSSPLTLQGRTGVNVGIVGGGSVALLSANGDVAVHGAVTASDFVADGVNVLLDRGITGRSASLTADNRVTLGGPIVLTRLADSPSVAATLLVAGQDVTVDTLVNVQDVATFRGSLPTGNTLAITANAHFANMTTLNLTASTLTIDPAAQFTNVGTINTTHTDGLPIAEAPPRDGATGDSQQP